MWEFSPRFPHSLFCGRLESLAERHLSPYARLVVYLILFSRVFASSGQAINTLTCIGKCMLRLSRFLKLAPLTENTLHHWLPMMSWRVRSLHAAASAMPVPPCKAGQPQQELLPPGSIHCVMISSPHLGPYGETLMLRHETPHLALLGPVNGPLPHSP